jgi:hypothetical protein
MKRLEQRLSDLGATDFILRVADAFGLAHPYIVGPDVGMREEIDCGRHPFSSDLECPQEKMR